MKDMLKIFLLLLLYIIEILSMRLSRCYSVEKLYYNNRMPYLIKRTNNGYGLYNIDKKVFKSYDTTLENVIKQKRLLDYIDHMKKK